MGFFTRDDGSGNAQQPDAAGDDQQASYRARARPLDG